MSSTASPVVAAFDLDGTLTEGGSVFAWLRRIAGSSTTYRAAFRLIIPLTIGAVRSGRWADNAKERLFHLLLAGSDLAAIQSMSRDFALEHLESHGRELLLERLKWHIDEGHDVVIVSASPQIYVDVIAETLHAHGALGTRLAVDPLGKLTGGYLGKNCRGTEKMRRLDEWLEQRYEGQRPVLYAYGNSRGDRRLLAGATYAYDAGKLGWFGSLRKYPRARQGFGD